jgi:hypothetical protein
MGKLLGLRIGLKHEQMVAEWCEEAIAALSAISTSADVVQLEAGRGDRTASGDY